jgi:THO complex subunit 1
MSVFRYAHQGNFTNVLQGIQQLKDQGYAARFIFLQPPDISELSQRLRRRGSDDEDKIKARLEIAEKELEQAKVEGFHDKIFVNDDLQKTYEQLENYIFGKEDDAVEAVDEQSEVVDTELEMTDDAIAEGGAVKSEGNGAADAHDTPVEEKTSAVEDEEIIT